ncbi:MAG: sigma-70 family RNA polymerase sigma factor [Planctomycetes bacterium]|nr:sigma-70 family RNA polymerase sigma factor [Planctomycetota bacterium]MBI3844014.1 sigma-70 family RNA polymerase sigma factor [Planctomycetota bacterium]
MSKAVPTCWTVIQGAAAGNSEDREEFAQRYEPVIRAYLGSRWAQSPFLADLDDVVQEVFLECFRSGGVLDTVDPAKPGGFRPFLYGVLRNVALRAEARQAKQANRSPATSVDLEAIARSETTLSRLFDREWAKVQVRAAGELHEQRARQEGPEALRRIELLRLRFAGEMPIREIAKHWNMDADLLHREQTRARREFKQALIDVVHFQHPAPPEEVLRECEEILALLASDAPARS